MRERLYKETEDFKVQYNLDKKQGMIKINEKER